MASYLFKTFAHAAPPSGATTVLFTVPVGHIYVVKSAIVDSVRTAAAAATISLEKSNNVGAAFQPVAPAINLTATNGVQDHLNFAKGASNPRSASTTVVNLPTNDLDNMVFEAGSVLRLVATGGGATLTTEISGIDYTI